VGIIVIALLIWKPPRILTALLQRRKRKELELEFGRRVEEIKAELARKLPQQAQLAVPGPVAQPYVRLAENSPRAVVSEAWRVAELAALEAARTLAGEEFRNRTLTYEAMRCLEQSDAFDRSAIALLRDLRGLRNDTAHAPESVLSAAVALEYAASAEAVARYLREVKEKLPIKPMSP
jgi:hypothetical protein